MAVGSIVGHFSNAHFAACFGASLAGFSATLAVFVVVLAALLGALLTDFGAECAEAVGNAVADLAVGTGHEGGGHAAEIRTVAVQLDAIGHHLRIRFGQARGRAVLAFVRTGLAGLDAVVVFLVHGVGVLGFVRQGSENQASNAGRVG